MAPADRAECRLKCVVEKAGADIKVSDFAHFTQEKHIIKKTGADMKVSELVQLAREQQALIGQYPPDDPIKYVRDLVLATHVELAELLQELPWKPWKSRETQVNNKNRALDELADVVIFAIDIYVALTADERVTTEASDEVFVQSPEEPIDELFGELISGKIRLNIDRLKSGDHKAHKS